MGFMKGKELARAAVAAAAIAGMATIGSATASAQAACQAGGGVHVEFLGVGTSNSILMEQLDGSFQGDVRVRVYCGTDGSLIPNSTVAISTTIANSSVILPGGTEVPSTDPDKAEISLPTGEALVRIKSSDPNLNGWKAKVGKNLVTVTGAYGVGLDDTEYPNAEGQLWAQTPELSSLALFGSGAAGMAGYGLMRLRAMRRPKQ